MKLIDFSDLEPFAHWEPINDAVMGGLSDSRLYFDPAGHSVFSGNVSFANNGGFASVRSTINLGVSGVSAYFLDVMGDGKQYKFNLRTDTAFDGINYQCRFHPPAGIWTTCRLDCADFLPTWRGRVISDAAPLSPENVRQVGFMIADRQDGQFSLAIRRLAVEMRKD